MTLTVNKPVTLQNTADGTRYTLVLMPQGTVATAAPAGRRPGAPTARHPFGGDVSGQDAVATDHHHPLVRYVSSVPSGRLRLRAWLRCCWCLDVLWPPVRDLVGACTLRAVARTAPPVAECR